MRAGGLEGNTVQSGHWAITDNGRDNKELTRTECQTARVETINQINQFFISSQLSGVARGGVSQGLKCFMF